MPPTGKSRLVHLWREWGKPILLVLLVLGSFKSAIADWNDVPTASMKPTILEGDRIFVNKLAYDLKVPFTSWRIARWAEPRRGEVVVFFSPVDGTRLVKRVVGVPGDVIEMRNNFLIVNGKPVRYEPLDPADLIALDAGDSADRPVAREILDGAAHAVMLAPDRPSIRTFDSLTVPPGHYFMMGDNRDVSFDSRFYGFVDRDAIVGRALAVAISVDPQHFYRPRWHRFFLALR